MVFHVDKRSIKPLNYELPIAPSSHHPDLVFPLRDSGGVGRAPPVAKASTGRKGRKKRKKRKTMKKKKKETETER